MSDGARIIDRGYRNYEGPRLGVRSSIWVVTLHSLARVMGLGRGAKAKVLPVFIVILAVLPAVVYVGMAALLPRSLVESDVLPGYGDYYGNITAAILIFAAFVAPELLCTDRRTRMLGLLLASPLDRGTYLVAKALAVVISLGVITIGPLLLMLVAYTLEGVGPDGPGEWLALLVRIVVAGLVIAALHAALSLAVSSFTDRKRNASIAIVLILTLTAAATGTLRSATDGSGAYALLDLLNLPFTLVTRIHTDVEPSFPELSTGLVTAAYLAWTIGFTALVVFRYRRIQVTR